MKVTYYFAVAGILYIIASGHALLLRSCTGTPGEVYIVPTPYQKYFAEGGKARLYLIRGYSPASHIFDEFGHCKGRVRFQVNNCDRAFRAALLKILSSYYPAQGYFEYSFFVLESGYSKFIATAAEGVHHHQSDSC